MKETTYGWYPPARDLISDYTSKQPLDSYTKECMYKHSKSRYADQPGVTTPEDPLDNKYWQASPQQVQKYKSICQSPSPQRTSRPQSKSSIINLEIRGVSQSRATPPAEDGRQTATPVLSKSLQRVSSETRMFSPSASYAQKPRPIKGTTIRAAKAWATNTTETKIPGLQEYLRECSKQRLTPQPLSSRQSPSPSLQSYVRKSMPVSPLQRDVMGTSPMHRDVTSSVDRRDRVKSATTYRPRVDAPRRSIVSAGPSRLSDEVKGQGKEYPKSADQLIEEFERVKAEEDDGEASIRSADSLQHPADVVEILEPGKEELGVDLPLDYEEQLNKYGWRMQVHGDPLNLKKPCIAKRMAFTSKIQDPCIAPNPPKARKENWDTFFLNTIPRKPMSFTIHQEWASEMLHAKRMELQKRDGDTYKYRHTDYAFIY